MHATSTQTEEATPTGGEPEPILEASGLVHAFGSVSVLDGASLSVREGAVTAMIGPNGTGKSTLLRILIGAIDPDDGTVVYRGPDVPRPIGYLPQRPAFRSGFTVAETIDFYARLVGERSFDVDATLERVGLTDARETRVEALSGGMTRLLGIAQATIGDPPIIVLDEPASGLDPGMRTRVYEIAAELAGSGTAVLVTTHALALAERFVDRIALLDDGAVLATGSPAELRSETGTDSLQGVYEHYTIGDARRVAVRREDR